METEAQKGKVSCPRPYSLAQPFHHLASETSDLPVAPVHDVPGKQVFSEYLGKGGRVEGSSAKPPRPYLTGKTPAPGRAGTRGELKHCNLVCLGMESRRNSEEKQLTGRTGSVGAFRKLCGRGPRPGKPPFPVVTGLCQRGLDESVPKMAFHG